jgi:hypothetical protein
LQNKETKNIQNANIMKRTLLLLILGFGLGMMGWGQVTLPHTDVMNYTVGQSLTTQTGWTLLNTATNDMLIASGNLSFTGLPASTGNKVTFSSAGEDAAKSFTQQTSGTIYFSFLLNVTSLGSLNTTGGYFAGFTEGSAATFGATVWTRLDGTGYDIGINPRTTAANSVWTSGTTSTNTTIFVVISYQLVASTSNDVVKLWINPTPGGTEPVATLSATNTGIDLANVNRILLRQDGASATPAIEMDEFRIGTSWAEVTPSAGNTSPTVTTQAVTSIGTTTATGNGTITATGGVDADTRGVCWDLATNADPDIDDSHSTESGTFGIGAFTGSIDGLTAGNQYKVRAYATNSVGKGTGYGGVVTFTTLSNEPTNHPTGFTATANSQTQIDLAFSAASTITNCAGYLILQKTGSAPTGAPTDGNGYSTGNAIGDGTVAAIITNTADVSKSITGLTSGTHYYFMLFPYNWDGLNATTYNYKTDETVPTTDATTYNPLDETSEVDGPILTGQPDPIGISSLVDSDAEAIRVFDMDIYDYGTDGQPTKITQVTIKAGTNNTANWANTIQGVKLSINGGTSFVTIDTPTIGASSIVIPVVSGNLNIPDASAETLSLYIYLKSSGLTDNQILEFKVDATAASHGFTADATGSTFLATFATAPVSNQMLIDVDATKLNFATQPSNTTVNTNFSAAVEALDANNNRDLDATTSVTMGASAGTLSSVTGLTKSLVDGLYSWTDLRNDTPGTGVTLSATGAITSATSNAFRILSTEPVTQASAILFSNVGINSMTVSWTSGTGTNRIVVVKAGGTPTIPTDGSTYSANSEYGLGGTIAANEFVLYNGSGNTVDVTGLTGSTSYTFKVFEYNGSAGTENYLTTSNAQTQSTTGLTYYSNGSVDPTVTTNWKTNRDGTGASPSNFTSGETFVIENGDNMSTTAIWTISGTNSKLWIENGATLTANNAITLTAATFQIDNGGIYVHNNTGTPSSTIFAGTESFGANSNFKINNWINNTTSITTGVTLPYGNLEINWTGNSANWQQGLSGTINLCAGNLTVTSVGTGSFRFSAGTAPSVTVVGNYAQAAGTVNLASTSGSSVCVLNVGGNFSVNGGTLTSTSTGSKVVFSGSVNHDFIKAGTISTVSFEVANTSTLNMGTQVMTGGSFSLPAGTTLRTAHASGINGSITVSGTKTLSTGANYEFSGSGTQVTGALLPATVNNLVISETSDLTISNAGTLTVSGNLTIGSTAKITLGSTQSLTVSGTLTNSGDETNLIIQSDATGTGSLICNQSVLATVKRYLTQNYYHYISSPVATQAISPEFINTGGTVGSQSEIDLFKWDETTNTWDNIKEDLDPSTWDPAFGANFTIAKGYVYANRTGNVTKNFAGAINVANQTINLTVTPDQSNGWNIVGNPFASQMAANGNAQATDNLIAVNANASIFAEGGYEALYFWDETIPDYVPVNNISVAYFVNPGQAFMIKAKTHNSDFAFNTNMRKHGTSPFYKSSNSDDFNRFTLGITGPEGDYNETLLGFAPGVTTGLDDGFDAIKRKGNSNIALYSKLVNGGAGDFAIQALPQSSANEVVAISLDANKTGTYVFKAGDTDNMEYFTVKLEDRLTNTFTTLEGAAQYSFAVLTAGKIENRFYLHFKSSVGIEDPAATEKAIYSSGHNIYFETSGNATLDIFNLTGQKIESRQINSGGLQIINLQAPTGWYIVKLVSGNEVKSQKVFIN